MIGDLLSAPGALGAFVMAVLVFGLAPGAALTLIVKLLAKDDPRRAELYAELYAVPRWERPFWVAEQLEVTLREGLWPQLSWYWGRHVWHRATIESGLESHRLWPESFWVPSDEEKAELRPGDMVKLQWSVQRYEASGERMWVYIDERDGERLIGRLKNCPMFVHLKPDQTIRFHLDDIIDYAFSDDDEEEVGAGAV